MAQNEFMTEKEFELLKGLINKEFGILIKGDKRLTLHMKISHRLKILGLKSYADYYNFITSDTSKEELYVFASHVTNNETYFFREKEQLDVFSDIIKDIKKERQKRNQNKLGILSLACSSGEEPYTLNILVQDSGFFIWDWDIKIIGIDIDKAAIEKAREACFTKNSFRPDSELFSPGKDFIGKYFSEKSERYYLKKIYTKNMEFRHGNLLDRDTFYGIEDMDVVFCRNVLIYMDDSAIKKIAENLHNCLSDTGYLFIGSAESLIQKTDLFMPEHIQGTIVYRKNVKN